MNYHSNSHGSRHTTTTPPATAGRLGTALLLLALTAVSSYLFGDMWAAAPPPGVPAADHAISIILQPGPDLTATALQEQVIPYLRSHHQKLGAQYAIWCADHAADGRSSPAATPTDTLQTPSQGGGGSLLLPEKWELFWSTLSGIFTDLVPPPTSPPVAPPRPALLAQIRAVAADRARSREAAATIPAATAAANAQDHTLLIISTLEDAAVFPDSAVPTTLVPQPPPDVSLLAHTRVCVWQLTPLERDPTQLKDFWHEWLLRSGATSVEWVHTAAAPVVPADRVTAIVLDASDTLQEKDRQGLMDLLFTITAKGELVQLYVLDPQAAGHFLTPYEVTRQDEAGFRAAITTHLQDLGQQQGTDQSAIIQLVLEVSRNPRFSLAAVRQTFADYPGRSRRQIILLTDLQENVRGSSLDLSVSPPWWRREGVWAHFKGDTHYAWADTKASLKDIDFFVRQVRRPKETNKDIAALRTFWGSLLLDAGATIQRWDVEQ